MYLEYYPSSKYMVFKIEHDGRELEGTINIVRRNYYYMSKCPVRGCKTEVIKNSTHPGHRLAMMEHMKSHETKGDF